MNRAKLELLAWGPMVGSGTGIVFRALELLFLNSSASLSRNTLDPGLVKDQPEDLSLWLQLVESYGELSNHTR